MISNSTELWNVGFLYEGSVAVRKAGVERGGVSLDAREGGAEVDAGGRGKSALFCMFSMGVPSVAGRGRGGLL